eukprot:CAMPEP_0195293242 /NCGR_PEP_ID=MMETSP0707-20130614/12036_1 /TAXON_ID=33640 /ORGANISM="Asterionellopsis glacialis, Strain CCMP134" /LENGTH=510 /DNA_ID=CAMNT_0040353911 /DNA_START=578 /DNA_END=2110 /DNA_ORIENTATION=+
MHPIYDTHGKKGKQASLPANEAKGLPLRPAWAHTICCFILTNKIGAGVYGCDSNGKYYNANSDEDQSSDSDAESEISWDKKSDLVSTARFVIAGKENGVHTKESWSVEEHRTELKCSICGKKDGGKGILRIPVQCCAGNDCEFEEYKNRHIEMSQPCFVALHVGCAMWGESGGEAPRFRRVWFYPGHVSENENDGYNNTVAEIYCDAHAADISLNKPDRAHQAKAAPKNNSLSDVPIVASKRPSVAGPVALTAAAKKNPAIPPRARKNLAHERRLMKLQSKKKVKKPFVRDIHLSSTVPMRQSSNKRALVPNADNSEPLNHQTLSPLLASGNAIPKLMRKKGKTEIQSGKLVDRKQPENGGLQAEGDKNWFSDIRKDISGIIKAGREAGKSDEEMKPDVVNRRLYWKETTGLAKADFKQLWAKVKDQINETMNPTDAPDSAPRTSRSLKHGKPSQSHNSNEDEPRQSIDTLTFEQMHDIKSPWQSLWVGDKNYSAFDIGDWDTYKITKTA